MRHVRLSRLPKIVIVLLMTLFMACSGNDSQTNSDSAQHNAIALASIKSGGANNLYLDSGRIYYSDYNRGIIYSVSASGGEITSHYLNGFVSPWRVVHGGNKIFILNAITDIGGILSLPDDAAGINPLYQEALMAPDIVTDDTYVYWSADNKILRTPLILTGNSSIETMFTGTINNKVSFVLDGETIFAIENATRDIYKLNLSSGVTSLLVSGIGASDPGWLAGITLAVTNQSLYVKDYRNDIYSVNKQSGSYTKVTSTFFSPPVSGARIRSTGDALYWWVSDASSLYLKRLNEALDQIETVTTIPFTWNFLDFYPDGTNVYWFTYDYNSTGDQTIHAWRIPVAGGAIENVASFDGYLGTNGGMAPYFLTGDADSLYWTSQSINALLKMPKSGGTPTVITWEVGYAGPKIAVKGTDIYLGDGEGVKKVPIAGQAAPTAEWTSSTPIDITRDDVNLYWIVNSGVTATYPQGSFDVYSKPVAGGVAQRLFSLSNYGQRLYAYNDYLYFILSTADGGGITRMPKIGGQEEPLVETIGGEPADLFIINDKLYFTFDGIYQIDLQTWQEKILLASSPSTDQLYVDANHIYFTKDPLYGGGVYRIPLNGGSVEPLSGSAGWKIVGDTDNIYWAAGSKIFKMAK